MQKIRKKYGSALVFSLIILFIGVVMALGIASTAVISKKMSGTTGKSTSSFQIADSGAEIVLQKIYKDDTLTDLQSLASSLGTSCSSGNIASSISSGKDYSITFFKDDGSGNDVPVIDCSTTQISDITKIKSVGTYASTSRAVEVAVAAGGVLSGTVCGHWSSTGQDGQIPCDGLNPSIECPNGYTKRGQRTMIDGSIQVVIYFCTKD
ncbi:MAG: pilus assembly PilX N-terminal domain-containing protein [Patescibacteria group bacterium]